MPLNQEQQDLYAQLEAFSFDRENVELSFAERLARENDWTMDYTSRVLLEYKRFIFLIVEAGHPVTPSIDVDEAWHLHLTYSTSYWTDLCQDLLGQSLHHIPTNGGEAENQKFREQYKFTLARYVDLFDEDPPKDIWPLSIARFDPKNQPMKMLRKNHVMFSRAKVDTIGNYFVCIGSIITLMAGAAIGFGWNGLGNILLIALFGGIGLAALGITILWLGHLGGGGSNTGNGGTVGSCGTGCGGGCGGGGCSG